MTARRARPVPTPRRMAGFTILELMIATAIVAIMFKIGAPSFKSFLASSQLSSGAADFYDAARFARSQAAQLNRVVRLCPYDPSASPSGCDPSSPTNTTSNWATGIQAVDENAPGARLRIWPGISGNIAIASASTLTTASAKFISVNPDGSMSFSSTGSAELAGGTYYMKYCNTAAGSGSSGRSVILNSAGFLTTAVANSSTAGAYGSCP